ncbi:TetR/AcrR family transcriptional regulator [Litorivivens sp.]|uniref:TetR/AcrR family transcriptional regulator n=1 Tax=Litorivivens sp. TaxID=2020868 RepID=UPI003563F651
MTTVTVIKSADESNLSRREQRKMEVRGRINEAALALFSAKGVELTTVEEICESAEVARKTFYNYYSSKQDLIRALSDSMLYDETSNVIELALEKYDSTRERVEYIYGVMIDNLQRYEELERCLVHQALLDLSSENSQIGQRLGDLNAAFSELVRDGLRLGDVSESYSAEFIGEMIVGLINATIINWVHDPGYPVFERIEEVKRLTLASFLKH